MAINCKDASHVWTVETRSSSLHPGLDLIPGRQCLCGAMIIFEHQCGVLPPHSFHVKSITSPAVRKFAKRNPNLVTWK